MAHNESLKLLSTISRSTIVTYPFLIIDLSKLFSRVFSASTSETAASDSVESMDWPAAILDSQCRWTLGASLTHTMMIEEALIWILKDSFPTKFADYGAETWRELFRFITATMMKGLRRETLARKT